MRIEMIGLGRMGGNIARRLSKGGHQCIVFDRNRETVDALAKEGPLPAYSLKELVEKLSAPRAVWVMLLSSGPTEETVTALSKRALLPVGRIRSFSIGDTRWCCRFVRRNANASCARLVAPTFTQYSADSRNLVGATPAGGADLQAAALTLPSDTLAKLEALGTKSEQKPKEEI